MVLATNARDDSSGRARREQAQEVWGVMGRVGVLSGACTRGDELHECKPSCSSVSFVLGAVPEANEGASLSALTGARIHTAVSHASTQRGRVFNRGIFLPCVHGLGDCVLFVRCHLLLTFISCFSDRFGRQIADGRPQKRRRSLWKGDTARIELRVHFTDCGCIGCSTIAISAGPQRHAVHICRPATRPCVDNHV